MYENCQRQSCSMAIPVSNGPYTLLRNVTLQPKIYLKVTHPIKIVDRARAVSLS